MEGQVKCFLGKVKFKGLSKKKKIKNMNRKMITNSQVLTTEP